MIKKILIGVIMIFIGVTLFFYSSFFFGKKITEDLGISVDNHNGSQIKMLLNEDNYNKVGINPDKYTSFKSFLEDFKSFTGVLIDPVNEKFVVGINSSSGNVVFIPFDFKNSGDVFDNSINKNLAILDIYNAYKSESIYGGVDSNYGNKILFEEDLQHPLTSQLRKIFDVNLFDQSNNVFNIIDELSKSEEIGISNTELLSYLYDFTGNYTKATEKRNSICEKYKTDCDKKTNVNLSGKVYDANGKPLSGVKIELLNDTNIFGKTDVDGNFTIKFSYFPFSHLRFKSTLTGYSDGFSTVSLNNYYSDESNLSLSFKLQKADDSFLINNENKAEFKKGKYYIIETDFSKYFIPINGLYYMNGRSYTKDNFDIYSYLFTKSSNMNSMLENDTFEPVYGYVGNIMKTFGMPYIQFVDKDTGEELYIKSSNPMILQNQVYHMKELYENSDQIYQELTDDDMKFLFEQSEELGGYPIDFDFLTKNNLLRWPARWSLDRKTGVWSNVGSRVLNINGLVELPFYHIKDN